MKQNLKRKNNVEKLHLCEKCFFLNTNACCNPKAEIILCNCCSYKEENKAKSRNFICSIWDKIKVMFSKKAKK